MDNLTPGMVADMADRHGIQPVGETPWKKMLTAGSDDHSGLYAACAHTVTPYAATVVDYLEHLRAGRHWTGGHGGTSLRLAHTFYHIAYSYYVQRFLGRTSRNSSLIGAMLKKMAGERPAPDNGGFRSLMKRPLARVAKGVKRQRLNETERLIVDEFEKLTRAEKMDGESGVDIRNFQVAGRISHQLAYAFLQRFAAEIKKGNLLESLQSISSLGPVAMGIAPYLTAFHTQHKDELFLREFAAHYPATQHAIRKTGRRLWVTDTFSEVNGVARTIRELADHAYRRGEDIVVATCMDKTSEESFPVKNFQPVGVMALPEYPSQHVAFPPFLDIFEYIEREGFDEIIISTPGPFGIAARTAAHLFGLDMKGIYHTDFPDYIRHFTDDETLTEVARNYMAWFYGDMQTVYVSSRPYVNQLSAWGIPVDRLRHLPHGVDLNRFNPSHRDPAFWPTIGVNGGFKYLYVGRISREKNIETMLDAFLKLVERGETAELVVVGDGPHYADLTSKYNNPHIAFTGCLEGEALSRAFACADVFVFPSMTDTFGNVVLEAQASGLPAIVANRGGPPEIVAHEKTGLVVDASEPASLTDAMLRLKNDDALRASLGKEALAAAQRYTWDAALDHFLLKS